MKLEKVGITIDKNVLFYLRKQQEREGWNLLKKKRNKRIR